jgi:hypothetical protein
MGINNHGIHHKAIRQFFTNDPCQKKGLATCRFSEFEPVKRQSFLEDWIA